MSSALLFTADTEGELWQVVDASFDHGTGHKRWQSSRSRSREQHRKNIVAWIFFDSDLDKLLSLLYTR